MSNESLPREQSHSKAIIAGDLLGAASYGETLKTSAEALFKGAGAFLGRICLPAAEEFGFLLQDKIRVWRATNAAKILSKAENLLPKNEEGPVSANPRVVSEIIEKGSWTDEDVVQEMWAGLLASSCTSHGNDDGNILFVSILSQLTSLQVKILNYACENSKKLVSRSGLPYADSFEVGRDAFVEFTGIVDIHRLDRELDYLRSQQLIGDGLFGGGFDFEENIVHLSPSALALHLYVRGKGFSGSPIQFWNLESNPSS